MKILLIGEFSNVNNYLADGLKFLGHNVFLANTGDGQRAFYYDYNWKQGTKPNFVGKIQQIVNLYTHRYLFRGYDIVQVIMPSYNGRLPYINKLFAKYLIDNNHKLFWTPAGTSDIITKFWVENKIMKSAIYDYYFETARREHKKLNYEWRNRLNYEKWFVDNINGIIPICFEYAEPFRTHPNFLGTIPLPINTDKLKYQENIVSDKIIFYHGETRPVKGTVYIKEAFDRLKDIYNGVAEFICNKQLPYNEYVKIINKANVIIDQTNSYGSGMSGLISMAKGKVVMGGGELQAIREMKYDFCPIVNITSNVNQICNAIESIINRKNEINQIGADSRRFIETYHDYRVVAKQFIEKWKV